jgi:ATP adenylyltransferase
MIENLWAGWRMNFLQASDGTPVGSSTGCILCELGQGGDGDFDQEHFVIHRAKRCYIVLNAYPYAAGHLMVVPYAHLGDLLDFEPSASQEALELARKSVAVLRNVYNPEGFNFGANIGRAGGAAFGDHLHFHVVPRWLGDTNFMTTLASSRVIPEALSDTYKRLKDHFRA